MIQIQHLTKRFAAAGATVVALNDINLEIQDGDIYGIIGMSGAGKSTLVRCINMLERPDEGKVIVNGREMMRLSPAELRDARREITMIFQQFNLLMQRTCLKNVTKHLAPGAIVVFHDSEKAFRNMRYALPRTLEKIRQMGLKCKAIEL